MAKGNDYEWVFARQLSLWLTDGQDRKQLIRSVQSGGWEGKNIPQVGDLAPNGPRGRTFRERFGVEVKAHAKDPELWHHYTSARPIFFVWFDKVAAECLPHNLIPLLIMSRKYRPNVVMLPARVIPFHTEWKTYMVLHRSFGQSVYLVPLDDFLSVPFDDYVAEWF